MVRRTETPTKPNSSAKPVKAKSVYSNGTLSVPSRYPLPSNLPEPIALIALFT